MYRRFMFSFLLVTMFLMVSACGEAFEDQSDTERQPNHDTNNNGEDDATPTVRQRGWHLVDSFLSTPDALSYESQTMQGETGITILTFFDETEGHVHLNVHSHWTQGFHNNATTFLGDGIYHWTPPEAYLGVGERFTISMRVEPLSSGMNLMLVGYSSWPFKDSVEEAFFANYLTSSPENTTLYYIRTLETETLYSRALGEGEVGDYIAMRITLYNGLMSGIYWYYVYQWVEGEPS